MKYELMLILKPLLPEDIRDKAVSKIEKILKKHEGEIINSDVWGKRHLAYPIENNDEGYYIVYKFNTEISKVNNINEELGRIDDILRFLISKVEK
jgi:small subunit ribosomal protein S6